jgi:hypothetical protein
MDLTPDIDANGYIEPFDVLLDARLEAAGDDMDELCKVARWMLDRAEAGDFAAMLAVINILDGPAEFADDSDD